MKLSFKDDILQTLFGGGIADYEMLEKCEYDFEDILNDIKGFTSVDEMKFNDILLGAIDLYRLHIENAIENKISEYENELKYLDDYEETCGGSRETYYEILDYRDRIEKLNELYVFDDIEYNINYLDTQIWFANDEVKAIYREFLSKEIDEENEKIGFVELDYRD